MKVMALVISALLLCTLGQAKPILNSSNLKSYIESIKIKLVVGSKYEEFSFDAQGTVSPNGEVTILNPKLILDKKVYGLALDRKDGVTSPSYKGVSSVASIVCNTMGLLSSLDQSRLVDKTGDSVQVEVRGGNGLLYLAAVLSSATKTVVNQFSCQ